MAETQGLAAQESAMARQDEPRWMTETPEQIVMEEFINLGSDPIAAGITRFSDGEEMVVAMKIPGYIGYQDTEGKAHRDPLTAQKIRDSYTKLFPGEVVPLLYSRSFNTIPARPDTRFIDNAANRYYLESVDYWYNEFVTTHFPVNKDIVVMELLESDKWQLVWSEIDHHPDQAEKIFDTAIKQYFQLLVASHAAGITHRDRKPGDFHFNTQQQRLLVTDWDVPIEANREGEATDSRMALNWFALNPDSPEQPEVQPTFRNKIDLVRLMRLALKNNYTTTAQDCLQLINRIIAGETEQTLKPDIDKLLLTTGSEIDKNEPMKVIAPELPVGKPREHAERLAQIEAQDRISKSEERIETGSLRIGWEHLADNIFTAWNLKVLQDDLPHCTQQERDTFAEPALFLYGFDTYIERARERNFAKFESWPEEVRLQVMKDAFDFLLFGEQVPQEVEERLRNSLSAISTDTALAEYLSLSPIPSVLNRLLTSKI